RRAVDAEGRLEQAVDEPGTVVDLALEADVGTIEGIGGVDLIGGVDDRARRTGGAEDKVRGLRLGVEVVIQAQEAPAQDRIDTGPPAAVRAAIATTGAAAAAVTAAT